MEIFIKFTSVAYSAGKISCVKHIFDNLQTHEQIANAIPKGATIENIVDITANFEVDGDKLLGWLLEHGELK